MNFRKYGDKTAFKQDFDKEKIFVEKCGQKINCYDAIQAANIDTNIYEVMKKYHCQEDDAVEYMKQHGGEKGIYADITKLQEQIKDLGDAKTLVDKAQNMFDALPTEIKQKYGSNLDLFLKEQAKKQAEKEQPKPKDEVVNNETKPKDEVVNNETK